MNPKITGIAVVLLAGFLVIAATVIRASREREPARAGPRSNTRAETSKLETTPRESNGPSSPRPQPPSRDAQSKAMDAVMAQDLVNALERAASSGDRKLILALQSGLKKSTAASIPIIRQRISTASDSAVQNVLQNTLEQME